MNTNNGRQSGRVIRRSVDGFAASPRRRKYADQSVAPQAISSGPKTQRANDTSPEVSKHTEVPHFDLPRYTPHKKPTHIVKRHIKWGKIAMRLSASFGVIVLLAGGLLLWRSYINIHKVFSGSGTVAALSTQRVAPELLKGEGSGRVNILLLGIGGPNHPGGDLTDTIVVLSVDPVNKTAAMLSVPRDLWVKMPVNYFGAYQKINAAYSSAKYKYLGEVDLTSSNQAAIHAGFAAADQAVSEVLGINIDYHVLVNFQAFRQAVDTVGGVTVDVKNQLYDPTMAWENNNNPVLAAVGVQTMQGKQALNYARSRETSSDFARSERQRQLLLALKEKVLTLGTLSSPLKINNLMNAFGSNVHTDMSTDAAFRLFSIMKDVGDSNVASLSLTEPESLVTTDRVGNISVVRPRAGFNVYSDIQAYVHSQLKDGYIVRENAPVYVVGANENAVAAATQELKEYGYNVTGSGVSSGENLPKKAIVDLSNGASPYTLHYLEGRYNISSTTKLPAHITVPNGTQFVIIAST